MIIRPIQSKDIDIITKLMVDSFFDAEIFTYIAKDDKRRKGFLELYMKSMLKQGVRTGKVFVTDDLKAVAIWDKPNVQDDLFKAFDDTVLSLYLTKEEKNRLITYTNFQKDVLSEFVNGAYWLLSFICVDKDSRLKGYASSLLLYGANITKRTKYPCFLNTSSKQLASLYEKRGYSLISKTTIPNTIMTNYILKLN